MLYLIETRNEGIFLLQSRYTPIKLDYAAFFIAEIDPSYVRIRKRSPATTVPDYLVEDIDNASVTDYNKLVTMLYTMYRVCENSDIKQYRYCTSDFINNDELCQQEKSRNRA